MVAPALLCWCAGHSESGRRALPAQEMVNLWRTKANRAVLHMRRRSKAASTLIRAAKAAGRSRERKTSRAVSLRPRVDNSRTPEAERNNLETSVDGREPAAKGGLSYCRGRTPFISSSAEFVRSQKTNSLRGGWRTIFLSSGRQPSRGSATRMGISTAGCANKGVC